MGNGPVLLLTPELWGKLAQTVLFFGVTLSDEAQSGMVAPVGTRVMWISVMSRG